MDCKGKHIRIHGELISVVNGRALLPSDGIVSQLSLASALDYTAPETVSAMNPDPELV